MSNNARPGHGVSPKLRACGLRVHGPPKPRTSIAFDLRQEPGAGKPHAGICAGGRGNPVPYRYNDPGAPREAAAWTDAAAVRRMTAKTI